MATKTITFDGLPLEVTDAAEAAITKLQNQAKDAADKLDAAEKQVVTLTTDKATLEAKVTDLEKQITDARVTPAKLRDAAKEFQAIVDKAKALGVEVTDEMDEPAIMKAAVVAKVGDASKNWTDEHIAISFSTLSAQVEDETDDVDPLRAGIRDAATVKTEDAKVHDAYQAMIDDLAKASKPKHLQTA